MWFKHNMSIAQQMILIYNTTIPLCIRTKSDVALDVAKLLMPYVKDTNRPQELIILVICFSVFIHNIVHN